MAHKYEKIKRCWKLRASPVSWGMDQFSLSFWGGGGGGGRENKRENKIMQSKPKVKLPKLNVKHNTEKNPLYGMLD